MSRKKILLFDLAGPYFPGGCEKYFANLAAYLSQKKSITVIESRGYFKFMNLVYFLLSRRNLSAIKMVKRNIGKSSLINFELMSLIPFTRSYFRTKEILNKFQVIYAKNEFQELIFLWYFLRGQYNKKVVIGVHSAIFVPNTVKGIWKYLHDLQYNGKIYRYLLRNSKQIHVNNTDYIKLISKQLGVPKSKLVCINNPIDWNTNLTLSKKGKFSIVWIGRLTEQKGIDRLNKILFHLKKLDCYQNIEIIIAGDGELKSEVELLEKSYKVVRYIGFIEDVQGLYNKADLSLFTAYFDTFAHAVLEPLSYGIPVVSYDIPGPRDMIRDEENGYLVSDDKEFAERIETLYKAYQKINTYNIWRKHIYESTNKRFSKAKTFNKLDILFD